MLTVDDRARHAAAELREQAARRPVPPMETFTAAEPMRRRSSRILVGAAAAAAAVVVALGVAVGSSGEDGDDVVEIASGVPVPAGVTPESFVVGGIGVRFDVPDDWRVVENAWAEVAIEGPDGGSAVFLWRMTPFEEANADEFGAIREEHAEASRDLTYQRLGTTTIDGRDAHVASYEWAAGPNRWRAQELGIDLGDGTFAVLALASIDESARRPLLDWIASTIEVDLDGAVVVPTMREELREDLGVAFDVPATWTEPSNPANDTFVLNIGGPQGFVLANRLPAAQVDGRVSQLEEIFDAVDVTEERIQHPAGPARLLRYRYPNGDGFASLDTEVLLDAGDGTVVQLVVGHGGGLPDAVIERIVQSVRITD